MSQQQKPSPGGEPAKQGGSNQPNEGAGGTSRPKDPNNDPDQTPDREVKNPPKADPGKDKGRQPYK